MTVDDRGDPPRGPDLASNALPGPVAPFGLQLLRPLFFLGPPEFNTVLRRLLFFFRVL